MDEACGAGEILVAVAGLEVNLRERELERLSVQGSSFISLPLRRMVSSMSGGREEFNST